jgi:transposase
MVYRDSDVQNDATGDFVTLRRYVSVLEAEFDRAALEAAGVEVRLLDVGTAAIIPQGGTAFGVRLQVRESDAARAKELLDNPDPVDESERAAHPELRKPKNDARWRAQVAADTEAQRAFRASIISLFVCPGIGHLYTAYLLFSVFPRWRELGKWGRINAVAATLVLAAVGVAVALVFLETNA